MSKASDTVWHEGLIYKLKQVGISGEALALINGFLNKRSQRVTLNGQSSSWLPEIMRSTSWCTEWLHFRSPIFLSIY